jgi:hypothetical protein
MKHHWLILPLLFVFSCEDKKEPDTTPPNISFISPTNGSHIEIGYRNFETELNIQVDIKDNEQVLKAECFIDNISYGVKSGSTFNWKIDAYPTFRQGNYIIKIIAEDINNNKSESSINFILDVYHSVGLHSWIIPIDDDYTWTFSNSAEDGNNFLTYKVLTIPPIGSEYFILKEGIYKLEIREKNYTLAISGKIDVDSWINLNLLIEGDSYVLEVEKPDN